MTRRGWIGSSLLIVTVGVGAVGLALWKQNSIRAADAAAANQPEPLEVITAAVAQPREHRRTSTAIGTVLALRSITLRNELPGTVRNVALTPGQIVEEGTVLVALDVAVEEAELAAQQAQATLAETEFARVQNLMEGYAASSIELERTRAERDVALANIARIKAIIARKTIRAPFRARVGMADVHPGQYLEEGTQLTTLQGVEDAVHVDFAVAQHVAAGLRQGDRVEIAAGAEAAAVPAEIVAIDARVDPTTRNAWARARIDADDAPGPGASVRVRVPAGPPRAAVVVPVSAVRKGPEGDHVFVIAPDDKDEPRTYLRRVQSGAMLGDEMLIVSGLSEGEKVAASGAFKLRDGLRVMIIDVSAKR